MNSAKRRLEQARFTLGDYELREPDYQQIVRWADAFGCRAEDVLEILEHKFDDDYMESPLQIRFTVVDGRMHSLVWDCDRLPAEGWTWHDGLDMPTLAFIWSAPSGRLPIPLSALPLRAYKSARGGVIRSEY